MSNSLRPHGLVHGILQNTGVGSLSLFQGIFATEGSNPGLLHRRQTLYQLSHKGSLATKHTHPHTHAHTHTHAQGCMFPCPPGTPGGRLCLSAGRSVGPGAVVTPGASVSSQVPRHRNQGRLQAVLPELRGTAGPRPRKQ